MMADDSNARLEAFFTNPTSHPNRVASAPAVVEAPTVAKPAPEPYYSNPTSTPAVVEQPKVAPTPDEIAGEKLFGGKPEPVVVNLGIPAAIAAERDDNTPYSGGGAFDGVNEIFSRDAAELAGLTDAQIAHIRADDAAKANEWTKTMGDLGFEQGSASFAMSAADANIALAEQGKLTAEVILAQRAESERLLAERFGPDASTALAAARALVARDPRVQRQLKAFALEDHSSCVIPIAIKAMQRYRAGKLKLA